jgi:hypothetical protein
MTAAVRCDRGIPMSVHRKHSSGFNLGVTRGSADVNSHTIVTREVAVHTTPSTLGPGGKAFGRAQSVQFTHAGPDG